MQKSAAISSWNDNFGELNLHCKIVGSHCVDWACAHQIVVATSQKIVICDMSIVTSAKKVEEIGFMIENLPEVRNNHSNDNEEPGFFSDFEHACSQPSNFKAFPNYDIYKAYLDPSLYGDKQREYKGFKGVSFSPFISSKAFSGELLGVLSQDECLAIFKKVKDGIKLKWKLCVNLSNLLHKYMEANDGRLADSASCPSATELDLLKLKKHSLSFICFAWSDIFMFDDELVCFLAACTKNGFVVIWKFEISTNTEIQTEIADVFWNGNDDISAISWKKNLSSKIQQSNSLLLEFAISNQIGHISCFKRELITGTNNSCRTSTCQSIWDENDRLVVKNMHWLMDEDESYMIAAKSHVLVAWKLDSELNVLEKYILQDIHSMPIVDLCIFHHDNQLQFYSCSSDGLISQINVVTSPQLTLEFAKFIAQPNDIGSFSDVTPSTLHGMKLSPNRAFLTMLLSRPHVRLSIQVDNIACLIWKRLVSPAEAASRLLKVAAADSSTETWFKYLDLIEIVRQHFVMTRKFEPSLVEFLNEANINMEYNIKKLQLRWHLLKIKDRIKTLNQRSYALARLTQMQAEDCDDLKNVEKVLAVRQITKTLAIWLRCCTDEYCLNALPVVQLVRLLENKADYLNTEDSNMLKNIKSSPLYSKLPTNLTCAFTKLPVELSADAKVAVSSDGSSWPLCCLSFVMLQGYQKRTCRISGLFADMTSQNKPAWLNQLLSSSCIYSGSPLR